MRESSAQRVRYGNLFKHFENPWSYIGFKLGFKKADPLQFTLKDGIHIRVPVRRKNDFKSITMDDSYLKCFRKEAFAHRQHMTVLDVGANLGFFSLYAKSKFPQARIYAFEPLDINYDYLMKNVEANPGIAEQVTCIKAALCSQTGTVTLTESRHDDFPTGASILNSDPDGVEFSASAIGMADFYSQYGVNEVTLMKMDCEGGEFDILYNSDPQLVQKIQNITMEAHQMDTPNGSRAALCEFLNQRGFHCCLAEDPYFLWASRHPENLVECTHPAKAAQGDRSEKPVTSTP